jgi:DNA-binding PadR family transcriptional regulator
MIDELLVIWEDTYKKGQLTFWLFLALKHGEKYVEEIQNFIQEFSEKTISYDEQSLYRSLRKFQHLGIVEYALKPGKSGPERKYYRLTPSGLELFEKFIKRNIFLLQSPNILKLLKS